MSDGNWDRFEKKSNTKRLVNTQKHTRRQLKIEIENRNKIEKHGSGELKINLSIFKTFSTLLDGT